LLPTLALALAALLAPPKGVILDHQPAFTEITRTLAAPNRAIVRFASPAHRLAAAAEGYKLLRNIPQLGYSVVLVPYGRVDTSIQRLKSLGYVTEAFPDRVYHPAYTPNDPVFPDQWNLVDQRIPQVWDVEKGNPSVVIAVLDTGVDYNHSDLNANIRRNTADPINGADDDGNGYVDDYWGWDFAYNDRNPMDDHGHGTACAGINAAIQDNNYQISGVAPRCRIMCVKIGQSDGYSYDSMFAPGVVYAADNGAKVLSISYFSDDLTPLLRAACDYAYGKGALLSVAAGNFDEVFPVYPAGYDRAIGVAAHGQGGTKAYFSNFGTWVDVSAPGIGVPASTLGGGYTTGFAGTSAAAPNAAGVLGLLFSHFPGESNEQIRRRLEYTAAPIASTQEGEVCNYGRVDALAALGFGDSDPNNGLAGLRGKPPEVRYVSPMVLPAEGGRITIRGRYFDPGVKGVWLRVGNTRIRTTYWSDEVVEAEVPPGTPSGVLVVDALGASNGIPITIAGPGVRFQAVPSDFSNAIIPVGGGLSPFGTARDLWFADGQVARFAADYAGQDFDMRILVRGLDKNSISQLSASITRTLGPVGANAGGALQLYDFSTGSYPYGSWATVLTENFTMQTGTVTAEVGGDVSRFVSYEGDLFVRYRGNLKNSMGYVDVDRLWFEWK
jgi:thermitase